MSNLCLGIFFLDELNSLTVTLSTINLTSSEIGGYIYSLYQNIINVEKSSFESLFSQGEGSYII